MTAQLMKLREDRLREEVANLQEKSNCRQLIEQTLTNATTVAEETIRLNLRDLGLFGEIRLSCFKLHQQLSHQILHHMNRVTRAKKLTDSARTVHQEVVAERLGAEESLRERDAEQFLAWQRSRRA